MISKAFAFHAPSVQSGETIANIRRAYSSLKQLLETDVQPSRERSVALTELETSAMWAIKSVVSNDPHSIAQTED